MEILSSLQQLRDWRALQSSVVLVPTMGNLHAGHLRLVEIARQHGKNVVVSIFVNPLQFGQNEDLDRYPRTFSADCEALANAGADSVFAPTVEDVYPRGLAAQTIVEIPALGDILCGASRPGHFRGVATIVCKLFNMVQPQVAVFGQKDYQQLQVIRLMTTDLCLPIQIVGVATERAENGLALSSRNGYLSNAERQIAPIIYQTLLDMAKQLQQGTEITDVEMMGADTLTTAGLQIDYLSVRRQHDLSPPLGKDSELVVLVAAYLGTTRLIDNLEVVRSV